MDLLSQCTQNGGNGRVVEGSLAASSSVEQSGSPQRSESAPAEPPSPHASAAPRTPESERVRRMLSQRRQQQLPAGVQAVLCVQKDRSHFTGLIKVAQKCQSARLSGSSRIFGRSDGVRTCCIPSCISVRHEWVAPIGNGRQW